MKSIVFENVAKEYQKGKKLLKEALVDLVRMIGK